MCALLLPQSLDMQALNASFDHSNAAPGVMPEAVPAKCVSLLTMHVSQDGVL
jgi:hypothetical protein